MSCLYADPQRQTVKKLPRLSKIILTKIGLKI